MPTEHTTGSLQSRKDFKDTPEDQYRYWKTEIDASEKNLKNFLKEGSEVVTRYLGGKRKGTDGAKGNFRLNLFNSNVTTLQSMLFGNLPKIDVSRRYADATDDVGRVAAEIMERMLNNDVADNAETYNSILRAVLQDRLLPGLGVGRVRYETEIGDRPVVDGMGQPMINEEGEPETEEYLVSESAPLEYFHWGDVRWGWARTYSDIPWIAFRSRVDKDEIEERFGEEVAKDIELHNQSTSNSKDDAKDSEKDGPWQQAEVWEIWDKVSKKIVWYSPGYVKVLDTKEDFLKIPGFFPNPPFLLANQTTNQYVPVSDYYIAQDLYNEIDNLQTRISILTEAVKVVGAYDQSAGELKRIFNEGVDNDLIPVDNWALFSERGGISGLIDWVPIQEVTNAIEKLISLRDDTIGLLQQVTGMSDIMRGELSGQYEGVGQSNLKAKFGSVRVQALQDEFAQFASNLLQVRANIISKHFSPETIAKLANTGSFMEADREYIPQAIELIKDSETAQLRIEIRPESVAMVDFAQLKAERTDFLTAISTFMQSASPLMEQDPRVTPFLLQLLQWGLAGFKGSSEIEGVIDKAIQMAGQPDNAKVDKEDKAGQEAMQLEAMKHNNVMQQIQAKAQADGQREQSALQADLQKISADLQADLKQIMAKMQADIQTEAETSAINAQQARIAAIDEAAKIQLEHDLEIEQLREEHKHNLKEQANASVGTTSDNR